MMILAWVLLGAAWLLLLITVVLAVIRANEDVAP